MANPKSPVQFRKLAELKPNPKNARVHSEEQVAQVEASIRRFGWTNPVVADADLIDAGHGRCMAAERIYAAGDRIYLAPGEANGGAVVPDGTVPVIDSTGRTDVEKRAYALADNQLAINSTWDEAILNEELAALTLADFDIALIGFDTETELGMPGGTRQLNPLQDTEFSHVDQYGIIIKCDDERQQDERFNVLREQYGADNVKVVVV